MNLVHFNPHAQSEEDFLQGFVARRRDLDYFLDQLRSGPDARHFLIVAPRGFGKTSLLRRIAIAVRRAAELAERYIPLSFREEQHNVISLDVFWRNALQALMDAREDEGAPASALRALDAAWQRHPPRHDRPRGQQDGAPAFEAFQGFCRKLERRPVLLVDNLDLLLKGLEPGHQWALRRNLQEKDGPLMLAAAPRYPEGIDDRKTAFYDFFQIHTLDRLEDDEVLLCLRTLAERRGKKGKAALRLLSLEPGRVAALNTLAGGNPRTLGVLYQVLEAQGATDILEQLGTMLDTFTGWYESRTEELPTQARAVFDALALNWDPMTAAALGEATGLETVKVSSQLTRLARKGYVEEVDLTLTGRGRKGYQLKERFYNIWYLMRNGPRRTRRRVEFLTRFLQSCFGSRDRLRMARRVLRESDGLDPAYTVAMALSVDDDQLEDRLFDRAIRDVASQGRREDRRWIDERRRKGRLHDPSEPLSPSLPLAGRGEARASVRGELELGDASLTARVRDARRMLDMGVTQVRDDRWSEALETFASLAAQFGEASELALREQVARALVNKGVVLRGTGRPDEAIAVYDEVVARFGGASEPALREQVAWALVNKGVALGRVDRPDGEIAVYDEVVARFGEASGPGLREQVAWALVNKGVALQWMGRPDEAIAVYDEVVARFGEASELELRERVAKALFNKGVVLGWMGRPDEAIAAYDEVVARFSGASEPPLCDRVVEALLGTAAEHALLGRAEEARRALDEVSRRKPRTSRTWNQLGNVMLDVFGDHGEAVAAYREAAKLAKDHESRSFAVANLAYAVALHGGAEREVREAVREAAEGLSPGGRALLETLPSLREAAAGGGWGEVFGGIDRAVDCGDPELWTTHLDDLQRIAAFIVDHGGGTAFVEWMKSAGYPMEQAPFYHAVAAAVEGEEHLLRINPEVGAPARRIHRGIVQRRRKKKG